MASSNGRITGWSVLGLVHTISERTTARYGIENTTVILGEGRERRMGRGGRGSGSGREGKGGGGCRIYMIFYRSLQL